MWGISGNVVLGSSPLARGALADDHLVVSPPGIIPARAGSACRRRGSPAQRRDHPRSRGERQREPWGSRGRGGSSPLARGARPRQSSPPVPGRIIPARAGSAPRGCSGCTPTWDHPRSRGERRIRLTHTGPRAGSSPLARGAPAVHAVRVSGQGIIPARAGSASRAWWAVRHQRDHPRSRGERCSNPAPGRGGRGSSPLARGALMTLPRTSNPQGIIPARAGSATTTSSTPGSARDHPRSRGERMGDTSVDLVVEGSSPLARGALAHVVPPRRRVRIIPARAGSAR